jgi:hypothetical protein
MEAFNYVPEGRNMRFLETKKINGTDVSLD